MFSLFSNVCKNPKPHIKTQKRETTRRRVRATCTRGPGVGIRDREIAPTASPPRASYRLPPRLRLRRAAAPWREKGKRKITCSIYLISNLYVGTYYED